MAFDVALFENPHNGKLRGAPLGFSWTTLFFGPLPMLFRGAWKLFFIEFLSAIFTLGFAWLYWIFAVNRHYAKELISDGFQLKSTRRTTFEGVARYIGMPVTRETTLA